MRGLHIVIINPKTGKIHGTYVFDTYLSSKHLDNFIKGNNVPYGFIVVAACQDDFSKNMSIDGIMWFKDNLGSAEIEKI